MTSIVSLREQPSASSLQTFSEKVPSLSEMGSAAFLKHPDTSIDHFRLRHVSICEEFNRNNIEKTQKTLQGFLRPYADKADTYCILTTGSDGRYEKLNKDQSPIELIIFTNQEQFDENLIKSIKDFISTHKDYYKELDKKCLESKVCECLGRNIPTRGLHSKFLTGGSEQHRIYLKNLITEIKALSSKEYKTSKRQFYSSNLGKLKKCIIDRKDESIDFALGQLCYDSQGFNKRATKYTALRAVQYALDKIICDYIRKKDITPEQALAFLEKIPNNTMDLIDYLFNSQLLRSLSSSDIEILKKAYFLSLMYLHIAQHLCQGLKGPITIMLDEDHRKELEKSFSDIESILTRLNSQS